MKHISFIIFLTLSLFTLSGCLIEEGCEEDCSCSDPTRNPYYCRSGLIVQDMDPDAGVGEQYSTEDSSEEAADEESNEQEPSE